MNLKEIKELIEFAVSQDLDELEVEQSGFKIRIRKRTAAVAGPAALPAVVAASATPTVAASTAAPRPQPAAAETPADFHVIKSPIVGTFYRSASPDSEPFVKIGDFVEKGTVLCIIEAMKLMNEIESEISGEIVETYVENGTPVEYGEPLFAVRLRS